MTSVIQDILNNGKAINDELGKKISLLKIIIIGIHIIMYFIR
jgi:hypothetical protein